MLQKGYMRYEDLPLKTKDGRNISVEFVSNVYDVDHRRVIQCNIRNITERKRAEEALKASEVSYRRLFESAKDGILIIDAMTDWSTMQIRFKRFIGLSLEEIKGRNYGK